VNAVAFRYIGKEADNLEEREYLGDGSEDAVEHGLTRQDRARLRRHILEIQKGMGVSDRLLCAEARVASRTLTAQRRNRKVEERALFALAEAVERIRSAEAKSAANEAERIFGFKASRIR